MEQYLEFAKNLAQEAGAIIKQNFRLGMSKEWKSNNSPVTETDIVINKMVIERVMQHFPEHEVQGEEESMRLGGAEYLWVCDPVDGTMPFSQGIPTSVFSLALVKDGVPLLGVIYDPYMDRLFYAVKGKGAYLNDYEIKVSSQTAIEKSYFGLEGNTDIGGVRFEVLNLKGKVFTLGSVIYEGMLVACGELAGVFFAHTSAHDGAAIKVLVEEAGGKVTDLFGNEQRYDKSIKGFIASNGHLHQQLVGLVGRVMPQEFKDKLSRL